MRTCRKLAIVLTGSPDVQRAVPERRARLRVRRRIDDDGCCAIADSGIREIQWRYTMEQWQV